LENFELEKDPSLRIHRGAGYGSFLAKGTERGRRRQREKAQPSIASLRGTIAEEKSELVAHGSREWKKRPQKLESK
jgi:hypothetical protein